MLPMARITAVLLSLLCLATPAVAHDPSAWGGLFRSRDDGGSWLPVDADLFIGAALAVAVSPTDPNHLLYATDSRLMRSRNGGRDWNHEAPLVIHCWAGISRSTAAALISLCALNEEGVEGDIATAIRRASPTAMPNSLMVAIADDLLGRRGRMVDAVRAIGEGKIAVAGKPFSIPSRFMRTI